MANILFAWEFGDNWGHLSRDLPVARRLRDAGHQVLFAVYDTRIGQDILAPAGFGFVQAPFSRRIARATRPLANHAEMLVAHGYGELGTLCGLVAGWHGLYGLCRPDAVVIDYAPTAYLAARVKRIPALLMGSGFELPPRQSPLPAFRPWEKPSQERLLLAEGLALRTINGVLAGTDTQPLTQLAELFDGEHKLLTTFAELDHYGAQAGLVYTGPVFELPKARPVHWPEGMDGRRVFAYLRPNVGQVEALLSALQASGAVAVCAFPGATPSQIGRFSSPRLQLYPEPVSLEPLLPDADLVVGYGSGTIAAALLAGAPLLLVPFLVEQLLAASRVEALGAGLTVRGEPTQAAYGTAIAWLLGEPRFKAAATGFAQKYRGFDPGKAADMIATTTLGIVNQ
jgi:UDP:flavonoid glycosyltransferase YjiC (YdhE family)